MRLTGLTGLLRAAALAGLGLLASGCLVIEERAVDVAALEAFFPLEDGAEHTYCSDPAEGVGECLQVRVSRAELNGATWARLHPLNAGAADSAEEDLFLLFFRDAGLGDLAFMRIEEDDPVLLLTRAEATQGGVRLVIPNCTTDAGNELGAAAVAAGAEADQHGCVFADQQSLFEVAKAIAPGRDFPLFGTATIER